MSEPDGWDFDFDQALAVNVTFYPDDGDAEITFEDAGGPMEGGWRFPDFPGWDFMNAGLNIVGPWLNKRGLAYQSWLEPEAHHHTATVYRWEGSDVDPRIVARRGSN